MAQRAKGPGPGRIPVALSVDRAGYLRKEKLKPERIGNLMKKTYSGLRLPTRKWFNRVKNEWDLNEHHLRLLLNVCCCWDRAQQARETIAEQGLFIVDRFDQRREHPAAKTERDSMIAFTRILRELGLDLEPPKDIRPPMRPGNY